MSDKEEDVVICEIHGKQQLTIVCQHIGKGLQDRQRVGFFWSIEGEGSRHDAYCSECNQRVAKTNGEWVGDALEKANPQILCGACYDIAKKFHMGGELEALKVVIDCSGIKNETELHDLLAKKMAFPEYYGNNLDALNDVLRDVNYTMLILKNHEHLKKSLGDRYDKFIEVFAAADPYNFSYTLD